MQATMPPEVASELLLAPRALNILRDLHWFGLVGQFRVHEPLVLFISILRKTLRKSKNKRCLIEV